MSELAKFWSDDFDLDLLKVLPNLREALGATSDVPVWTVGHETYGRLNHPCVWNSHGAFFWLEKPNLPRDEHGWFNIHGCVSDEKEIEATWLEFLRDQWPHSYAALLIKPTGRMQAFHAPPRFAFDQLLYHLRGWRLDPEIDIRHAEAWDWVMAANLHFAHAAAKTREFPIGSVPGFNAPKVERLPLGASAIAASTEASA